MSPPISKRMNFTPQCTVGKWYACGGPGMTFIGCCGRDPCGTNSCSAGDLHQAGFDPKQYAEFPEPFCASGAQPWTCAFGPTFWGCCKSDPCKNQSICPHDDLASTFLNTDQLRIAYRASGVPTASATPSVSETLLPHNTEVHVAWIGGLIGGIVGLLAIGGLLIWYFYFVRKSRQRQNGSAAEHLTAEKNQTPWSPPPPRSGWPSPDPCLSHQDQFYQDNPHAQVRRNNCSDRPFSMQSHPSMSTILLGGRNYQQMSEISELPEQHMTGPSELGSSEASTALRAAFEHQQPGAAQAPVKLPAERNEPVDVQEGRSKAKNHDRGQVASSMEIKSGTSKPAKRFSPSPPPTPKDVPATANSPMMNLDESHLN